jgi:hypothetical protein
MKNFALLILLAVAANPATAQQPAPSVPPTPAANFAASPPPATEDLDVQYAKTYLQCAQLELQRALDTNRQIPGTFTGVSIDALQQAVTLAEGQLAHAMNKDEKKPALFIQSAEQNLQSAEANLKRAEAIHRQRPNAFPATELERLRLTTQLARLTLEKARAADPDHPQQFLQWQIDQLRLEVSQLRNRLAQLQRMN